MITRDIKANLVAKLEYILSGLEVGSQQYYTMKDTIDSMLSSSVTVTYSREECTSRPGDCEDASELVSRNID
jgi:hypothetical protein